MESDFAGKKFEPLWQIQRNLTSRTQHFPGVEYRCRNDRNFTIDYVSEGCLSLTGYKPEDLIRDRKINWNQLIHMDDRERVWQQIQSAVREGRPYTLEYRLITAGGNLKWVWTQGQGLPSLEGSVELLEGVVADITDRRRAEDALREKEMKFRGIFEWAGIGITLVDPEGRILETNPACRQMLGYSEREFPALRVSDFTHPDDIRQERILDRQLLGGERMSYRVEKRYIRSDGGVFWGRMTASLVRDAEGKPLYMIRMIEDITARKRAENALRESEAKYRLLAENITDVIWTTTPDLQITYASPSIFMLLGYPAEELLKMKLEDLLTPASFDLAQLILREDSRLHDVQPEGCQPRTVELELIRKNGSHIWAEVSTSFMLGEGGEIIGISGVARNITERKKVEEALRESEGRYRSFMSSFEGIAFRGDSQFKPLFMHGAVKTLTGYSEKEFLAGNVRWDSLVHPEDAARYLQSVQQMNSGKMGSAQREYRIRRQDGIIRWVREYIQNSEKADLYQGVIYDITETKRVEMELAEYRERMVQMERLASLGTMGATIAHQLNQPLTVIRLFLQHSLRELAKTSDFKQVKDNLNDCLGEVSHAITIISQYLTFARRTPEEGTSKVDIRNIAGKIVTVLSESARKAGMKLVLENLDGLPKIEGYACDIEQIFFILMQNAIQAVDKGRECRMTISGKATDEDVTLTFADTCRGIAPSDLDKIFEPFFTTKPPGQGTGLGLSILRRIITKYSGKVRVESEPGKGTIFTITLPLRF